MTHNNDGFNASIRQRLASNGKRIPERAPATQVDLPRVQLANDELKRALASGNTDRIARADQNVEASIADAAKPAEPKQRSHRDWGGGAAGGNTAPAPPSMDKLIRTGLRNSSGAGW